MVEVKCIVHTANCVSSVLIYVGNNTEESDLKHVANVTLLKLQSTIVHH